MNFVENHQSQLPYMAGLGEKHVAENLRRHHHDGSITINRTVSGQKTNLLLTVVVTELVIFLVRQSLKGCCVEGASVLAEGFFDRVRGNQGLPRPGWGTDQYVHVVIDSLKGLVLKIVNPEGQTRYEGLTKAHFLAILPTRMARK